MFLTSLQLFRKRHPQLTIRTPQRLSNSRACITETLIREWFDDLKGNLQNHGIEGILEDPSRVFNTDETNIQLSPKTGKVISLKGWRNIYEIAPAPEKSTLTFLGTFSASGAIACPTIVFPYVRLPTDIVQSVPDNFAIAISESGWMTAPVFYEFICNTFNNWLIEKKVNKPVILFLDGHTTHMTMQLSVKSQELGIILYLLPPYTTHILQPADVCIFKPLKNSFKKIVHDYQRDNLGTNIKRKDVGPFLEYCLSSLKLETIKKSFKVTGICPFNPEQVDYTKCVDLQIHSEESSESDSNNQTSRKSANFSETQHNIKNISQL